MLEAGNVFADLGIEGDALASPAGSTGLTLGERAG